MKSKNAFIILLTAVSLLFATLIIDFILPIFWAIVLAILFSPINQYLGNKINKPALTSLCTIVLISLLVHFLGPVESMNTKCYDSFIIPKLSWQHRVRGHFVLFGYHLWQILPLILLSLSISLPR